MNIRLMRWVDYWLGVPLCFLLTGIRHILKFFVFQKEDNANIQKLLFIKLSELGSIILAYPLLRKVKEEYPKAEIFFLTFAKNKVLFDILDITASCNVLAIRENSVFTFIVDTLKVIVRARKEKIDIVFDLELFSRFAALLSYLTAAPKRVGFYQYHIEGLYRGELLTHKVQYNPLLHISKSYLSLWQAAQGPEAILPSLAREITNKEVNLPRLSLSDKLKADIWTKLKKLDPNISSEDRLVIFSPNGGRMPLREWPLESFIALAKRLLEDQKNYILIVGMDMPAQKVRLMRNSLQQERCLDLTNKTSIPEVLGLCNIAQALVVNDSGLAHLAALTAIKQLVLFGPESPHIYSPLGDNIWIVYSNLPCSPCLSALNHRRSACKDNKCLQMIKPDEVYKIIKGQLGY